MLLAAADTPSAPLPREAVPLTPLSVPSIRIVVPLTPLRRLPFPEKRFFFVGDRVIAERRSLFQKYAASGYE